MTEWDMDVVASVDLTPLEKLVYHLPWYEKTVAELARMLGAKREQAARVVTNLVKKGLLIRVKYGTYQPATLTQNRNTEVTPVTPALRLPDRNIQVTPVTPALRLEPESVTPALRSDPNININKVIKYFNILDYKVETENERKRYNRCIAWLQQELTEECTSPDLIQRTALAYTHWMLNDKEIGQILTHGRLAVASGKVKLLCAYFAGSVKKILAEKKINLGTCRTKKQIAMGISADYQTRIDYGNPDLPGQRHFAHDAAWKGLAETGHCGQDTTQKISQNSTRPVKFSDYDEIALTGGLAGAGDLKSSVPLPKFGPAAVAEEKNKEDPRTTEVRNNLKRWKAEKEAQDRAKAEKKTNEIHVADISIKAAREMEPEWKPTLTYKEFCERMEEEPKSIQLKVDEIAARLKAVKRDMGDYLNHRESMTPEQRKDHAKKREETILKLKALLPTPTDHAGRVKRGQSAGFYANLFLKGHVPWEEIERRFIESNTKEKTA